MATRKKNISTSLPDFSDKNVTIGIVFSQWHSNITGELVDDVTEQLSECGVPFSSLIIDEVPGSFELPLAAQWLIKNHAPDAVICIGCLIKGETPHFDFIADAVSNGIMQLNLAHNIPVIFGVLTTTTLQQAEERSGGKHGSKGREAAISALKMIQLNQNIT